MPHHPWPGCSLKCGRTSMEFCLEFLPPDSATRTLLTSRAGQLPQEEVKAPLESDSEESEPGPP